LNLPRMTKCDPEHALKIRTLGGAPKQVSDPLSLGATPHAPILLCGKTVKLVNGPDIVALSLPYYAAQSSLCRNVMVVPHRCANYA